MGPITSHRICFHRIVNLDHLKLSLVSGTIIIDHANKIIDNMATYSEIHSQIQMSQKTSVCLQK